MNPRRVLFLDSTHLTVYRWQRGAVDIEAEFPLTEVAGFAAFLESRKRGLYYLLADVPDDGYQVDEIPWVRGNDREALIKRRLAQYYFGTPLAAAISQGRNKDGRRDERILFAAFTRPQHIQPWLDALTEARLPLAGLYSVPQVMDQLIAPLTQTAPRFLLITLTSGGLRQSFFDGGQLRFSRLAQTPAALEDEMVLLCATEAVKTHQYLSAQRMVSRDVPLDVYLLAHAENAAVIRDGHLNSLELRFSVLDFVPEAKRLGLAGTPSPAKHSETLLAHLLASRPPATQFAPPAARHFFQLWRAHLGLRLTGLAALTAGLVAAAALFFLAAQKRGEIETLAASTAGMNQRYQAMLDALPKVNISKDELRALMARYDELDKRAAGPQPLYQRLSQTLAEFPRIDIERLNWTVVNRVEDAFIGSGARPAAAAAAAVPATAPASAAPKPLGAGPFAVLDITATLPLSMASDHRGQLDLLDQFTAKLGADPALQVQILTRPFDAGSTKTIKSGGDAIIPEAPRFAVRVIQKL